MDPDRGFPAARRIAAAVYAGLLRLRLTNLIENYRARPVRAVFTLINGSLSIGLLAAVAHTTGSPFIFPSLGPTAFLLFYKPAAESACPRNTFFGHLIGAGAGWLSLAAFGLLDAPPALTSGVGWGRAGAAALSLGGTSGLMVLLGVAHPPAGATTLIVSLGLMPHLWQIPVLMAAVVLLLAQAWAINRLAGVHYPTWSPLPTGEESSSTGG